MRVQRVLQDAGAPSAPAPTASSDKLWDKLRVSTFAVVWQKEDDPHSVLRVVEVLDVNTEYQEFTGWYYIHGARVKRGEYAHEMPLVQRRLVPEWRNNRTGLAEVKPSAAVKANCRRVCTEFSAATAELIATGWSLESHGKIPNVVIKTCDAWLRAHQRIEPRIVLALSDPNDAELAAAAKIR